MLNEIEHRRLAPLITALIVVHCPATSLAIEAQAAIDEIIEEIVVTAHKRSRQLQKAPAAVTVLDGNALSIRGITTLADIQNLVPSVRMQKESASTEIYIRGVGSTLDLPMIEPPNAYNINGIYIPREVTSASLVDVDRIEVLPGPQGTLYGRGAIGGVANTVLVRPSDEMHTNVMFELGNYDHLRTTLTQNLPINDRVRARGAVSYFERDGLLKSGADSADDLALLLSIEANPSDNMNLYVWSHIESREGSAANLLSKGAVNDPTSQLFPTGDPWEDRLLGDLESYATLGPIDAQARNWDTTIIGAEVDWKISENLSLTYLPSYLELDWRQGYWLTHKKGDFGATIDQQTHELRLAWNGDHALTWLAGIYAYRIETAGQLFIQFGPDELFPGSPAGLWLDASDVRHHQLEGTALFGEMTYALTSRSRLVAGGRLSYDEKVGAGFQPDIVVEPAVDTDPVALFTGTAPASWSNSESWNHIDWKLGIEFDAGTDSLLYANVQTGYQPGTFDVFPDTTTPESELLATTLGARNRFFESQLVFNTELFYYVYENLLTQAFDAATGTNRLTSADVDIYGVQIDTRVTPGNWTNTTVDLSVGYLHTRYEDFLVDELDLYNGNQLQNAPDWTVSLRLLHSWPLRSGANISADLQSRYESGFWGDFSHSPGIYQEGYTKTNVALTYYSKDDRWSLGVWALNLENQDVQAAAATGNLLTDPGPGAPFLEPPRTYGIRVTYRSQ
jgi:iron complex outermembrane receptor protein